MACTRCEMRGKTWNGDDPKCAFLNINAFSPDNWNCATANAIRDLFGDEWNDDDDLPPFAFRRRYDDQSAAAIHIGELELETCRADVLFVGWYKSRGNTESMWLLGDADPAPPSLADCEAILQHFAPNTDD